MNHAKTAATSVPLHPLLAERWSPRSFDRQYPLTERELLPLLEAARWSPSANNSQPWRFALTLRGSAEFDAIVETLAAGNRAWADAASALVVVAAETAGPDGSPRPWATYDTGQAAAHLSVQAEYEGLAVHQMGGFDRDALADLLDAPAAVTPLVVLAIGRRATADGLAEPFLSRELAARTRRPVEELLLGVDARAEESAA
ncbi:nitroreductase family protein [Herbiconiux sp. SYSU D00978]|uniref:nitroreductase family protein n=1 Tax=Herbiconiux sp. SYSU D00978 TaxID=2812562 RepID=UPI0027DDB2AE|nr:nitroreductase family protein [Herbiconiux sp. SYSU D00978]